MIQSQPAAAVLIAAADQGILRLLHNFAVETGGFFGGFLRAFSLLSENGIFLLITGLIMFLIKKTRHTGFCVSAAVCFSAACTLLLKRLLGRPRPFMEAGSVFVDWWQAVGVPGESGFAMPSGHTAVAAAAAAAVFLTMNRRRSWPVFLFVLLTGISRCYFMFHYPSDIAAGIVIGTAAGFFGLGARLLFLKLLSAAGKRPAAGGGGRI